MINSIDITNFQKHKNLNLEFDKITTIVGKTDCGKSAIIRALNWVLTNKPNGLDYISWGESYSSVKLSIDNNIVERYRSKSENIYRLNEQEYKAFGDNIPEDIKDIFNTSPYNFQNQFDSIFWFNSSSGQVAEELNKIVDLRVVDYTFSKLNTEKRSLQAENKVISSSMTKKQLELCDYENVEELREKANIHSSLLEKQEYTIQSIEKIGKIIENLKFNDYSKDEVVIKKFEKCFSLNNKIIKNDYNVNNISNLIITIENNKINSFDNIEKSYNNYKKQLLKYNEHSKKIGVLESSINNIVNIDFNKKSFNIENKTFKQIIECYNLIKENNNKINILEKLILILQKNIIGNFNFNRVELIFKEIKNNIKTIIKTENYLKTIKENDFNLLSQELKTIKQQLDDNKKVICPNCGYVM